MSDDTARCPSAGLGPEHREIRGGGEPWCPVCGELWTITNDVIDGPVMYGADLLVRGDDGVYRSKDKP